MTAFCLRPMTATALSLWPGILACVLGCANAKTASASAPETQVSGISAAPCSARDDGAAESCCHNPAGGSEKHGRHSISCCPAETALIQKQNVVPSSLLHLSLIVLALPDFRASSFVSTNATPSSILWHAGRDILLQVHVLRI